MQIAFCVEQMRREGYEVLVSRPEVIYRKTSKAARSSRLNDCSLKFPRTAMAW